MRFATAAISVSRAIDAYIARVSPAHSPRTVIDNGVDPSPPSGIRCVPFSRPMSLLELGCIGRLVPVKGQRYLLSALSRLNADEVNWICYVVGDGPDRKALEDLVRELGIVDRVRFLGYRKDVNDIVGQWDIVCIPSLSEGLPYAILKLPCRSDRSSLRQSAAYLNTFAKTKPYTLCRRATLSKSGRQSFERGGTRKRHCKSVGVHANWSRRDLLRTRWPC